ncbi:hypothetical protein GCM10028857_29880 [Salinarchaeum chitinilyticum]
MLPAPLVAFAPALGTLAQSQTEIGTGLFGSAVGAFLGTLIVGGIMILVFPEYTQQRIRDLVDEPVGSAVYGLIALVALVLVMVLLVLTIVGILVLIPLAILAYVLWAVGAAIAYVGIGDRLVGHDDGWLTPLLVGSAVNGLLVLTGIGGLVSFVIGAAGFGAVLRSWLG